jgi:hypothetical protein
VSSATIGTLRLLLQPCGDPRAVPTALLQEPLCGGAVTHVRRAAKAFARPHYREREHQMKKLFGPVILAAGLVVVSSVAEARCVTTRSGNRSVTNCNGVITERHGNRSVTYGPGGVTRRHGTRSTTYGPYGEVTQRHGLRSTTYGPGYTTHRRGRRSVTFGDYYPY